MAKKVKTLCDLTPTEARKAIMATLKFLRSEQADVANFGGLVLDESDGYPNGVTLGQAVDAIMEREALFASLPAGGAR